MSENQIDVLKDIAGEAKTIRQEVSEASDKQDIGKKSISAGIAQNFQNMIPGLVSKATAGAKSLSAGAVDVFKAGASQYGKEGDSAAVRSAMNKVPGANLVADLYTPGWKNFDRKFRETHQSAEQTVSNFAQQLAIYGAKMSDQDIAGMFMQVRAQKQREYDAAMNVETVLARDGWVNRLTGRSARDQKRAERRLQESFENDWSQQKLNEELGAILKKNSRSAKTQGAINYNRKLHDEY